MKYFYDTEFIEDGKTIDLISIGIVAEDGREYYAISTEFDETKASQWVIENVLSKLGEQKRSTREQINRELLEFIGDDKPEFWAYYADYDHVVFCQLFGTMMDLPKGWPMLTYDLRQYLDMTGHKDICQPSESPHNALDDAKWCKSAYEFLTLCKSQ